MSVEISLSAMVRRNAERFGEAVAYVDGERTLTHRRLAARAGALAAAFHVHGLQPQDRIAILALNGLEYGEVYAACELAGFISVPLNTRLKTAEIIALLEDSGARALVYQARFAEIAREIRRDLPGIETFVVVGDAEPGALAYEALIGAGAAAPPFLAAPDDIASILYTSGSSGRPKGCIVGQREYARLAQMVSGTLRLSPFDSAAVAMPVFHNGGKCLQAAAHWRGGTVVLMPEFRPAAYLAAVAARRVTVTLLGPSLIQMLLEEPSLGQHDLGALRMVMYSTAAMPESTLRQAIEAFGPIFQNNYGATECPGMLLEPEQHRPHGSVAEQARLKSAGAPYPNVDARLVREDGSLAADGEPGEIWIRSDAMFRGYWNDPQATAAALQDGWYRTGDLGQRDVDGFYYVIGRIKDVIISGGENIAASEVEEALMAHPEIREAAAVGIPHPTWGEAVCAVVVRAPGSRLTEDQVVAHCKARIASYKKPSQVVFMDALPKLASGKVDKKVLREQRA